MDPKRTGLKKEDVMYFTASYWTVLYLEAGDLEDSADNSEEPEPESYFQAYNCLASMRQFIVDPDSSSLSIPEEHKAAAPVAQCLEKYMSACLGTNLSRVLSPHILPCCRFIHMYLPLRNKRSSL